MSEEIHSVSPKDYIDVNREIDRLGKRIAELKQEQAQDTIRISEQTNRAVTAEWEIERLKRENAELQAYVDAHGTRTFFEQYVDIKRKLAAAEADTARRIANQFHMQFYVRSDHKYSSLDIWSWLNQIAIDVAKTEVKA